MCSSDLNGPIWVWGKRRTRISCKARWAWCGGPWCCGCYCCSSWAWLPGWGSAFSLRGRRGPPPALSGPEGPFFMAGDWAGWGEGRGIRPRRGGPGLPLRGKGGGQVCKGLAKLGGNNGACLCLGHPVWAGWGGLETAPGGRGMLGFGAIPEKNSPVMGWALY